MPLDKEQVTAAEICFGTSCSFCERACPVFQAIKNRTLSSRGKNRITLGLSKGKIKPSQELMEALLLCTSCGNCDRWCALPNTKNFRLLRQYLIENNIESKKHKKNIENIEKYNNPYAEDGKDWWQSRYKFATKSDVLFFAGCTLPLKEKQNLDSIMRVLGPERYMIMKDEPCCGSYALRTGYLDVHKRLSDKLFSFAKNNGIKEIVTVCAGCYSTLKETAEERKEKIKVTHYTEKIADDIKTGKLKISRKFGKLTYHDPCHLGRLGNVMDAPREILARAGTMVEMKGNRYESNCCGAGGGVRAAYPQIAQKIATKRIKEAKDTGAELLVTACPFCEGMFKSCGGIKICDIIEIVEECVAPSKT